ncbi:hypothetical protein L2E82_13566 [Cichorium intybus]|uniref:Uncharacterized protein n=1 Tax=Cichorium intybus TaxID=13427 RepID=A0ACB9EYV1_CICIN|nr:hypothetical protein L2E82_13566 [Cichorium intybus]
MPNFNASGINYIGIEFLVVGACRESRLYIGIGFLDQRESILYIGLVFGFRGCVNDDRSKKVDGGVRMMTMTAVVEALAQIISDKFGFPHLPYISIRAVSRTI